jgi:anti-sigma regulatory factor (Ser/Thr protein kinase)
VRTLEIAATAEAPTRVRRWLDDVSDLRVLGQVAFDVRLLATELVANSVRHAGLDESDLITVMLELSDARVRVEVRDPGDGFAFPVRPQKLDSEGGRGLQIVAAIAHRWGVDRSEPIAVWFEIDLERTTAVGRRVSRDCVHGLVP